MRELLDLVGASNGLFACCASIILAVIVGILAGAAMLEEWQEDHPNV